MDKAYAVFIAVEDYSMVNPSVINVVIFACFKNFFSHNMSSIFCPRLSLVQKWGRSKPIFPQQIKSAGSGEDAAHIVSVVPGDHRLNDNMGEKDH